QIEPGDHVYSLNEEMQWSRRKVVAKKYSGRQEVYRLRTENHREIRATANHPFLALTKTGKHLLLTWKPVAQLNVDDLVAISGALPDHGKPQTFEPFERVERKTSKLPAESSDDLMWFLGFYVGDGFPDGPSRTCIAVPETDKSYKRVLGLIRELF